MTETEYYTDENAQLAPKGEKLLSITEIAKYRNIPTERLRYYDKIGLLRPDYVDRLTGRRFYSAQQCEKLGTIKELRRLNLSLKEIEDYFNDRNLEKSERVLRQRYELLQKEIADKMEISRVLEQKLNFIKNLSATDFKLGAPEIKELPERYALKGESNRFRTNLTGIEFMKLEETIGGTSPVLATDKVAMTIKNSVDPDDMDSEVCPMVFCTASQADKPSFITVPAGKYVCAFHRNCYSYFGEIIMKMRCLAEEQGCTLGDEGVMIYRIDITLTDNNDETIAEIQFPLVKNIKATEV